MICMYCSKSINRHGDGKGLQTNHFRSCDADVCSWKCALARRKEISQFDPELNCPTNWHYSTYTTDTQKPKLKRSSSERLLYNNTLYNTRNSMDILPNISEKDEHPENNSSFSIVMLFTLALSLICVVRL